MNPLLLGGSIASCPDCTAQKDGLCHICVDFAALGEKFAEAQRHLQNLIEDRRKLAEMSVGECYDPITYMVPCLTCLRLDLPAYGKFYRAMDQWTYETFFSFPPSAGDRKFVSSISIRLGPHARSERAIALRRWIDLASQLPPSVRVICHATRNPLTPISIMHRILQVLCDFSH